MVELEYIDKRPFSFHGWKNYPGGKFLPMGDNKITVTEKEAEALLKCYKNGKNPMFKRVVHRRQIIKEDEE